MALKLKTRGINDCKKVLIYGNDGSGKSTFAETYCKENHLKPICIDIDDTNYTTVPIVDIDLGNDIKTFRNIKDTIMEIGRTPEYDTIIIDGVSSLTEMLVSKSKGLKKYADRAERFYTLLKAINETNKNIIFVGQADMEVIHNDEFQSNKLIVKTNSIVNEKYHTFIDKDGNYTYEIMKLRKVEAPAQNIDPKPKVEKPKVEGFETADKIETTDEDPVTENFVKTLIRELYEDNIPVTKSNILKQSYAHLKKKEIDSRTHKCVIKWCNENCPDELEILESEIVLEEGL